MAISSPGVGSGLDVNSIVSQLMKLENRPVDLLNQQEAGLQAKLTAYGTLKGYLSSFQSAVAGLASAAKFSTPTASVADTSILTATSSAGGATGTYNIEVSQLAQSQKLLAAGQATTTTAIGVGTLTFDFGTISGGTFTPYNSTTGSGGTYTGATFTSNGSGSKTVTIDATNNTLAGLRDAINNANVGVTATIVNDGSATPYRLVLSSNSTGATSSMKISVSGDPALSSLLAYDASNSTGQNLQQTLTAQNSQIKVDGVLVSSSSNTVTGAVPGATLNLLKTNVGSTVSVSLQKDTAGITSSVQGFVKAYNDVMKALTDLSKYDPKTRQAAILQGDATTRSIQTAIRSTLNVSLSSAGGGLTTLSDIGVSFQKDGTLSLDSTKLQSVLNDPGKDISTLFAAIGKPTDSLVSFVGATDSTKNGSYAVSVTRLATHGSAVGNAVIGSLVIDGTNNTLTARIDGVDVTVTLAAGTYSATQLATEIQSKLNGASALSGQELSVVVSQSGGVLTLTSNQYGSGSKVENISGTAATPAFGTVGYTNGTGLDVAGTIGGVTATGFGQTLTAATGDATGLALKISGGALGSRGTVNFAKGFAYQLNSLVGKYLASDGNISTRTDGINKQIASIDSRREALQRRLAMVEQRYRDQYTALDTMIASMTRTSTFLTQQLANLPKP